MICLVSAHKDGYNTHYHGERVKGLGEFVLHQVPRALIVGTASRFLEELIRAFL